MSTYYVNPSNGDQYEGDEMHPTIALACIDAPDGSITELHPHKVLEPIFVVTIETEDGDQHFEFSTLELAEQFAQAHAAQLTR